jgi:glutamate N-acetyltransferase/amino-acid N-acetyltransferase
MKASSPSITSPKGYQAAGIHCGLKKTDAPDLALILSDVPAHVAGVYTQNIVKGHSLQRTIELIHQKDQIRGVLINSGNANACIGPIGVQDANDAAAAVAQKIGCNAEDILTCSTGVIGQRMNMDAILSGIPLLTEALSSSPDAGHDAMRAIMTTDLVPKESTATIMIGGTKITLSGMAKGSGMIHPNLATMICVITTDAAINPALLQSLLSKAVVHTFNRVSVDGDTSICDSVLLMANGQSQSNMIQPDTKECEIFFEALVQMCTDLSRMIAKDGEGATKLIEVEVSGAASAQDAYLIALAVCRSPLCKTAIFGEDANWGRILTATGYSGASFDPEKIDIALGGLPVYTKGVALLFDENAAKKILQKSEVLISITLNEGEYSDRMWTCDFSYDYVRINGSYRS